MTRLSTLALCASICTLSPRFADAQIRASEVASVSQVVDGTKITVEYSRPRARGRDTLFGTKAVRWGETWTPGANWATTLDVSKPVKVNGKPLEKGKYSVWMVVRQSGDWTLVLEPQSHLFHMNPPDSSAKQLRLPVRVQAVPFTEVLTWAFPDVRNNGATLTMQWERVRIPIEIEVEPSLSPTLPAADANAYVGSYEYTERDSTGKAVKVSTFHVTYEGQTLKGRWEPDDPYMQTFAMIRIAPEWFTAGLYDKNGTIYEVLKPDMVIEFKRAGGRAASFVVRGEDDQVWATAARKKN